MQIFRRLTLALSIWFLSVTHAAIHAEALIISTYQDDNYPIWFRSTVTESGWDGMDAEIMETLMAKGGIDYRYEIYPFKRSLQKAKAGEVHVLPNLARTEERSEFLDWLGPVRYTSIGLIVKKNNSDLAINSLDDLVAISKSRNLQFAYISGAKYSSEFDDRIINDKQFQSAFYIVSSVDKARKMLAAGRVLGFFYDTFEAGLQIRTNRVNNGLTYNGFAIHDFEIPGSSDGVYFGISKKLAPNIIDSLRIIFYQMRVDGTYNRIYSKWAGEAPPAILLINNQAY